MNWYYSLADEQRGPVPEEELRALLTQGKIGNRTLVWSEGMTGWQPLETVLALSSGPVATGAEKRCGECRQQFSEENLAQIGDRWLCPRCKPFFLQKLMQGQPTGVATGVWRKQRQLVVSLDGPLPDRCLKCNAPGDGTRLKRKLYWHHPALYVMILFPGLLIYAIVAACVRKRATLLVSMCAAHRQRRRRTIAIAWGLVVLAIILFVMGINSDEVWWLIPLGILMFFAACIWGLIRSRVVVAKKIDRHHAYVGGACAAYLAELPEWTGP